MTHKDKVKSFYTDGMSWLRRNKFHYSLLSQRDIYHTP